MKQIICVGACYIDTILVVPHYPGEDEKLRATSLSKRRGGNCPNTLEVLQQLISISSREIPQHGDDVSLALLAVLPNSSSLATQFINDSLKGVELGYCIERTECEEAASSYIIRSELNGSRTIVNYNGLAEMTVEEFVIVAEKVGGDEENWWHFEGRIPDITIQCIEYLRQHHLTAKISVEVEKPRREGLEELAKLSDMVFYSKSWAQAKGFSDSQSFLLRHGESPGTRPIIEFCTWGEEGASGLELEGVVGIIDFETKKWPLPMNSRVIDTIGAGDTFVAGILFAYAIPSKPPPLTQALNFAVELAGKKVMQEGFLGLGEAMKESIADLRSRS